MSVTRGGLPGLPDIDWGTSFCHFYDSLGELLGVVLPFVRTGLENNEACLWLTAEPLLAADAHASLSSVVPDFDRRLQNGQIEIVDRSQWYARTGQTDVVDAWIQRQERGLAQGFSGLRLLSNVVRHSSADVPIDARFRGQRIVGLFSYRLAQCSSQDVLDIARRYQLTWTCRDSEIAATLGPGTAQEESAWLQRRSSADLRTENDLREADARKNEFLAMLGHDLRNPLASILTASQLMVLRGAEQQFHKELDIIQRQVSHITSMVDDLLDMSRMISGTVELELTSLEIVEAINRAIEIAAPLVDKRGHRLHVSCPPRGLVVNGDVTRLAQIVANLLTNAARYTEPGGDITVKAERSDGNVAVTVTDTGQGIDPKRLATLFEPFSHGRREPRQRRGDGLGLGLSIVRSLVGLHGGTIEAASTVGKGSEFVVRLPAVQNAPSSAAG